MVRRGAGGNGSMSGDLQSAGCSHPLAELPPSETEMAAWLYPIVRGDDLDSGEDKQKMEWLQTSTEGKCSEDTTRSNSSERRKKTTAGARKSHLAESHSLTEKKRRCKINERMKTLRHLVPGCGKCNQASTLDQTIKYMKSLQQQIEEMSFGRSMKPASAALYPFVPPRAAVSTGLPLTPAAAPGALVRGHTWPAVVLGLPPAMVPLAHHHPTIILPSPPMMYTNNVAPLPARRTGSAACCRRKSKN